MVHSYSYFIFILGECCCFMDLCKINCTIVGETNKIYHVFYNKLKIIHSNLLSQFLIAVIIIEIIQ